MTSKHAQRMRRDHWSPNRSTQQHHDLNLPPPVPCANFPIQAFQHCHWAHDPCLPPCPAWPYYILPLMLCQTPGASSYHQPNANSYGQYNGDLPYHSSANRHYQPNPYQSASVEYSRPSRPNYPLWIAPNNLPFRMGRREWVNYPGIDGTEIIAEPEGGYYTPTSRALPEPPRATRQTRPTDLTSLLGNLCGRYPRPSIYPENEETFKYSLSEVGRYFGVEAYPTSWPGYDDRNVATILRGTFEELLEDVNGTIQLATNVWEVETRPCFPPDVVWGFVHLGDYDLLGIARGVVRAMHEGCGGTNRGVVLRILGDRLDERELRKRRGWRVWQIRESKRFEERGWTFGDRRGGGDGLGIVGVETVMEGIRGEVRALRRRLGMDEEGGMEKPEEEVVDNRGFRRSRPGDGGYVVMKKKPDKSAAAGRVSEGEARNDDGETPGDAEQAEHARRDNIMARAKIEALRMRTEFYDLPPLRLRGVKRKYDEMMA